MSDDVNTLDSIIWEAIPKDEKWYKVSMWVKRADHDDTESLLIDQMSIEMQCDENSSATEGRG